MEVSEIRTIFTVETSGAAASSGKQPVLPDRAILRQMGDFETRRAPKKYDRTLS